MVPKEVQEAIRVLISIRDELVDMALSGNIAREHHLKNAIEGFELVGQYQVVIEDLRSWLEDLDPDDKPPSSVDGE